MIDTHPILDCHTELRGAVELLLGNLSVYWKLTACVGTRTPTSASFVQSRKWRASNFRIVRFA
jgi:hypothetical protein